MIRRTYLPVLRRAGYAIEEHSDSAPPRVIATGMGKHEAASVARIITNAVDQFMIDNRLKRYVRDDNPKAILPARDRGH